MKYKIVLSPERAPPGPAHSLSVSSVIEDLISSLGTLSATDRGHAHSDGTSVVQIWLDKPQLRRDDPVFPPRAEEDDGAKAPAPRPAPAALPKDEQPEEEEFGKRPAPRRRRGTPMPSRVPSVGASSRHSAERPAATTVVVEDVKTSADGKTGAAGVAAPPSATARSSAPVQHADEPTPVPETPEAMVSAAVTDEGAFMQQPPAVSGQTPASNVVDMPALVRQLQALGQQLPPLLPQSWEMARDPASGVMYFFNRVTGETSWLPPHM